MSGAKHRDPLGAGRADCTGKDAAGPGTHGCSCSCRSCSFKIHCGLHISNCHRNCRGAGIKQPLAPDILARREAKAALRQEYRRRSAHRGKRSFGSRISAWVWIIRSAIRYGDLRDLLVMHSYECRWGSRGAGETAPLHWHIGHRKPLWYSVPSRIRHCILRYTVWPLLRIRSRWRKLKKQRHAG